MALKLLSKNEINKAKALDRQREVEEGRKLATRVDVLRETVSEEESNLKAFREKTIGAIQQDLDAKKVELDELTDDIRDAKEERDRLKKPLDREWEKVTHEKADLAVWSAELETKEALLAVRESAIANKAREAIVEMGRAENFKHLAAQDRALVSKTLEDAKHEAVLLTTQATLLSQEAELRQKSALLREEAVAIRARNVENRSINVEAYEARLFKKDLEMREGWKTLLETQKHNV